jgi:transketolase
MGLEDLAMMAAQPGITVLYPSDAMSMSRLVDAAARHKGLVYLRAGRPKSPVIYGADESFAIGGSKVLRKSQQDQVTIVAAGVTLFEALKAYDQLKAQGIQTRVVDLYSIVPIDRATLVDCAYATQKRVVTVEDHYAHGGLGDAVLGALSNEGLRVTKLAVRDIPRSGKPEELIDHFGIGVRSIVQAVMDLLKP